MAAYEVLLLNTAIPQIQAAQSGDTYVVPRAIAFNAGVNVVNNDVTIYGVTVGRGAGAVSTNTAVGASALAANTTGNGATAVGASALAGINISAYATAVGYNALNANTSGEANAGFGAYSLFKTTSGAYNTGAGVGALQNNITGANNTAVGYTALVNNTASNNTAVGYQALYNNTTGNQGVALGYRAGQGSTGGSNIHIGFDAGYASGAGEFNTVVGLQAGYNASGNRNTFIGFDAGFLTTGNRNTFVGGANAANEGAGYYVTTGSANTILGNYNGNQGGLDIRTASNYIVLSDGDGNPRLISNGSGEWAAGENPITGYRLVLKTADDTASSHATLMRNSSSTNLLVVRSDGYFSTGTAANSPYNATTANAANVVVDSGGQLYRSTSSLKYKRDVQDATHGLTEVMALRSVTYKGKNDGDTVFGGLIAEEVHVAGLTEFVQYADDGSPDALAYGNMVSLCIKAIQELKAELDSVKAELAILKGA